MSDAGLDRYSSRPCNSVSFKLKLIWPIIGIFNESRSNRIQSNVIPFLRRRFISPKQPVETAFLPVPNRPEILGFANAVCIVEPAFEPFCEGANRGIAINWCR